MANKYTSLKSLFTAIAESIRGKTGSTETIIADDFPELISTIETGADVSSSTLEYANQLLSPVTAYNKNGELITGSIQTKTSSNVSASGKTVTVPAGYYASQVSKDVTSGTMGAPTFSRSGNTITATAKPSASGYLTTSNSNSATYTINTQVGSGTSGTTAKTVVPASGYLFSSFTLNPIGPSFTYTVNSISGAQYGFSLNGNGYYESQNKGVSSSYAICRVNLTVTSVCNITFDVINYAENGYDYAIFGVLDSALSLSTTADSTVQKTFSGSSSSAVVNVTYNNVSTGSHFIDIKFRKDGSVDNNNDSVQFKIQSDGLSPENIKSGVTIFGVTGTYAPRFT